MSAHDKAFGAVLSLIALIVGGVYFYTLFTPYWVWALKIVLSVFMVIILVMVFWVGYAIATTPSIEEVESGVKKKHR